VLLIVFLLLEPRGVAGVGQRISLLVRRNRQQLQPSPPAAQGGTE